jgi:hypothetical protein
MRHGRGARGGQRLRFVTAVFGEGHRQAGLALERTFSRSNRRSDLTVFTDLPNTFRRSVQADMGRLTGGFHDSFFDADGGRRNVFKYAVIRRMQEEYPADTVVWLDADMLVFDDLRRHLREGHVNVISHGRRDGELVRCGNGLEVPGERYAISGMFSVPPGPALDRLETVTRERPSWQDDGAPNHRLGDQLILNHLVSDGRFPVHWVSDDRRFVYNLELADGVHPRVGDEKLGRIRWSLRGPRLDGRAIVTWYWIKQHLDRHIRDDFSSFAAPVRRRLRSLYLA